MFNTSDDLYTTYQFDNYGRTVMSSSKLGSGTSFGGGLYTYTGGTVDSDGSNIKALNRVSSSAYSSKNVRNYLKNHSAEKSGSWSNSYWLQEDSTYSVTRTTAEQLFGAYSWRITTTSVPDGGGGAYYQDFDTDTLKPGNYYTFSAYVKTSGITKSTSSSTAGYGACLAVRFTLDDGSTTSRQYSGFVSEDTSEYYNDGWTRESLYFEVPEDAASVRVYMVLRNATGKAYFDGLQLEVGSAVNPYNMLENSSFEEGSDNWTLVNEDSSTDKTSTDHYYSGEKALKFVGDGGAEKYAYQDVVVNGKKSDVYIVSGWAKAEAVPESEEGNREFEICVKVYYSDGSSVTKTKRAAFNRDVAGWQKASAAFNLSDGESNELTPVKIRVQLRYYNQANTVYFDQIQLLKDTYDAYTYDAEGNLVTAYENGDQTSNLSYDSESNLTSVLDAENNLYEYKYNDAHQVTEAKSPMGTKLLVTYEKGLVKTTTVSSEGGTMQILTQNLHNEEDTDKGIAYGAYRTVAKDANGNSTYYSYNLMSGELNSVSTPDGTTTSYTYNSDNGVLTQVSSEWSDTGMTVLYAYNDFYTQLASIKHNGFYYKFTYDKFGNVLTTKAGGHLLATNEYGSYNGLLLKTTYGNGDYKDYAYNSAGLLSEVKLNGSTNGAWSYNNAGQVIRYRDYLTDQMHAYEYDIIGRKVEENVTDLTITDSAKDSLLYRSQYAYNDLNLLRRWRISAGGRTIATTYSYNENGQTSSVSLNGDRSIDYTYDALGRLTDKSVTTETAIEYDYAYWNSDRNTGDETTYKTTLVRREMLGDMGYHYEYDDMGNIVLIKEGVRQSGTEVSFESSSTKITYEYDEQNQLVRENNVYLNQTIVYTYDDGGNLLKKQIYGYTTDATIGTTLKKTIEYTYGDAWRDLLTGYGGKTITYDETGNPTNYLGATLSWKCRQLRSLTTEDDVSITYKYDADGLRTKKTVDGDAYEYYYSDGLLVYEKREDVELYYYYDAEGHLARIQKVTSSGSTGYYTATNMRGDVEAIYDYQGDLVARYIYDSWGNIISIKNASGTNITSTSNIANQNPIRYRGYYYDAETGFYYLNSRYYDPVVGRFISADDTSVVNASPMGVTDKNLYAYCDNNPIIRIDSSGAIWETVLDVGSLAASVVEVAINPTDVWAWAGLVGDAIDLVPFVTGVGEVTRVIKTSRKADDVVAVARTLKNSKKVSSSVGTYEIMYASGKNYVGKGSFSRAIQSAVDHAKKIPLNNNLGDTVTSIRWKASSSSDRAFIEEYGMQLLKGVGNADTYNKIWSPGKNLYYSLGR